MLEIKNLSKNYGDRKALDNLSLKIENGEIYGFIGHNGAGKTTTVKCVVGILDFSEGSIFIDGKNIKEDPIGCKKEIAYIPDNPDLYNFMTGVEYLNFIGSIFGLTKAQLDERVEEYATLFEIKDDLANAISEYL